MNPQIEVQNRLIFDQKVGKMQGLSLLGVNYEEFHIIETLAKFT